MIEVIGSGTMGPGIAQVFAMSGHDVLLVARTAEGASKAREKIAGSLGRMHAKGLASPDSMENITIATDLADARQAGFIIESISEDENKKRSLYQELDQLCGPETIFASNTSSIPIERIASWTSRPDKVIGLHFFNPPQLMKLVEIIVARQTSEDVREKAMQLVQSIRKEPVTVIDSPAFVTSRLIMLMINEAVECLHQGIATKEDIDKSMRLGMNHPMGPLELADLVGLDVVLAIMKSMHEGFGNDKYKPSALLVEKVRDGELGKKSGIGFYNYRI